MRNFVLVFCLLSILLAIQAAPQQSSRPSTHRSPNPQVNLVRQGLIDKLCKNQEKNGGALSVSSSTQRTTSTSTTTIKPPATLKTRAPFRRARQATNAPTPAGPSCDNFNHLNFSELIELNKKLLKPVPNRPN